MPLEGHPALSHPQLTEMGEGAVKGETCDPPCDPRPNGPLSQCLIHVMRVTFSLLSQAQCVKAQRGWMA